MVATRRSEKKTAYMVGNRVEILTSDGITFGRLVRKIALGSILDQLPKDSLASLEAMAESDRHKKQAVEHWMVVVDGQDEEAPYSEHAFGKTVTAEDQLPGSVETSESDETGSANHSQTGAEESRGAPTASAVHSTHTSIATPTVAAVATTNSTTNSTTNESNTATHPTAAETSNNHHDHLPKMERKFAPTNSSRVSTPTKGPLLKKESPAKKKKTTKSPPPSRTHTPTPAARVNTRSSGQILYTATDDVETLLKQRRLDQPARSHKKKTPAQKPPQDPHVVKIPMQTGILYLYRGKRRSAKFVPLK